MGVSLSTDQFDARFDDAVARAEHGEEVIVCRDGKEVARIVPARASNGRKIQPIVLGSAVGAIEVLEGWDAPLTSDDLADWLGGSVFPSDLPG